MSPGALIAIATGLCGAVFFANGIRHAFARRKGRRRIAKIGKRLDAEDRKMVKRRSA
jgi:hypothetical protein